MVTSTEISDGECRVDLIDASRGLRQPKGTQLLPPEFFGPNPQHEAQNKGEFEKHKTLGVCFTCPNRWVTHTQNHCQCTFHGTAAPSSRRKPRNQGEYRVKGAVVPTAQQNLLTRRPPFLLESSTPPSPQTQSESGVGFGGGAPLRDRRNITPALAGTRTGESGDR